MVSTDLICDGTKFEACSFSHCEDMARKPENVQFGENVTYYCQVCHPITEEIFVQLLLFCTEIIGTRRVNSGF